ncbi:MAG TPA: hypothetical protein VHC69_10695 [Polyangiaceae bacterium]|nr:hypothetical protein [Polyangiaceae bacterium]
MRSGGFSAVLVPSLTLLLASCASDHTVAPAAKKADRTDAGADAGELYLGLTTPTDGFQVRSVGADIGPGEEKEYCEAARLPGGPDDEYDVSLVELANGPYSHHLGLAVADVGSDAEAELEALGAGNRKECPGPLLVFGGGIDIVGTIQVPRGESRLPPHVARKFHGGQYIVFDYHYANVSTDVIHARSAANFHVVAPSTVEHFAQLFSLNNVTIDVPPGQTASFTGECHFGTDMMVGGFTRHTHHFGTDFSVWYAGGSNDGAEIWTSHDWQSETEFLFPEPVMLHAGEGFRYRCTYDNDATTELRFGTSVRDEMCMLYGPAWAVNDGGGQLDLPDCNIVWIDDAGIGHSATEAGGYPKPSATNVNLCTLAYGPSIDDCQKCLCDSCADVGVKCAKDADCSPLLDCYSSCTDVNCATSCAPVLDQHSSGAGLFTELMECARAGCPSCVPGGTPTSF